MAGLRTSRCHLRRFQGSRYAPFCDPGPVRSLHLSLLPPGSLEDMVARRKTELVAAPSIRPAFGEKDFTCYTDEIRAFALDVRSSF